MDSLIAALVQVQQAQSCCQGCRRVRGPLAGGLMMASWGRGMLLGSRTHLSGITLDYCRPMESIIKSEQKKSAHAIDIGH